METPLNLASLPKYLSHEATAWELVEKLRWPDGEPVCPHCGTKSTDHYFIASQSGERKTKKGAVTYRRLWKCREAACRKQFSCLIGTVFESSKVPMSKWLLAIYLFSAAKNGVSAKELERQLGVAYPTAWFIGHRLRESMSREPVVSLMSGTIVADESFIGGAPRFKHQQGKPTRPGGKGRSGYPHHKTAVLSLVNRTTGEVRSRVIADTTGATLRKAIADQVNMAESTLHTDSWAPYRQIGAEFQDHQYVDHGSNEYVRYVNGDHVGTNAAESHFAQLKRSIDGTFHNVSKHHLSRYLDEFDFRHGTRKGTDAQRVERIIGGAEGKRLTYRPLTGRGNV